MVSQNSSEFHIISPISFQIPVYLAKTLSQNVYILQYPVKNQDKNFDNAEVINCCVKPVNQQIKIDFGINTNSKNYDGFKGEQLAVMADGKPSGGKDKDRPTFQSGTMDKQTFVSSKPVDSSSVQRFVIGTIQERDNQKEVHLVPIKCELN